MASPGKKIKPLQRIIQATLPSEWNMPEGRGYLQLSFNTCQLAKLPDMKDGEAPLKPGPISTMQEERYDFPLDLDFDDVDQPNVTESDDDMEEEDAAQARKTGMRTASIRLASNMLKQLDRKEFEDVPWLRSLDLSTNHIAKLDWAPASVARLMTLTLRNNRLTELGGLSKITTLRRLDVSFNQLTNLRGIEKLVHLRMLLASGNQLSGDFPTGLSSIQRLVVCDLSYNGLEGGNAGAAFSGLNNLSTLRLSHNMLLPNVMPSLVACFGKLYLRRLDLYGNPLAGDESYPDELLRVQPKLYQLDHMRQAAGELAAGMHGGAVSSRSVAEAIDAVANSALSQHAVKLEQHRAKHAKLLDTLLMQQEAAAAALDEYAKITNAKISQFKQSISEAKRTGKGESSVDKVLTFRNELLTNEKICQERYRGRMADSIAAVREALAKLQES